MRTTVSYLGCAVTIRRDDDRPLATVPAVVRQVARAVLRHGRAAALLTFRCEANRIRIVAACDEMRARRLSRRVKRAIRGVLPPEVVFARTRIDVLRDVWHVQAAFKSVLARSGWVDQVDPYQEGSNLVDLLGLRVVGQYTCSTVREHLPRINRAMLLERLGAGELGAEGLPQAWHTLGECTLAAVAAPDLRRRQHGLPEAKRAAVKVAASVLKTEAIGRLLCLDARTVRGLRNDAGNRVDPDLVCAVRLQLQLRAVLTPRRGAPT